jgi:uncharacterized protein YceK
MTKLIGTAFLAAAVVSLSGCGTMSNALLTPEEGGGKIYGGVRMDVEAGPKYIQEGFTPDNEIPRPASQAPCSLALGTYLMLVDLPLSVVGDTLTLPWIIAAELGKPSDAAEPGRLSKARAEP